MFEYDLIPVALTRGAGASEARGEWASVRDALNERARLGYRVVAVTDGAEGRAIIMERRPDQAAAGAGGAVTEAAEEITREAADPEATR